MFSEPFYHRVDYNQKTKKTAFGGFVSLLIYLLSALYFGYILFLFFNGSYSPTITSLTEGQEGLVTYDLDFSPFAFTFRLNNEVYTTWSTYFAVEMYLDNTGSGSGATDF